MGAIVDRRRQGARCHVLGSAAKSPAMETLSVKRRAAMLATLLAGAACSVAGPAVPLRMDLDRDFSLKVGEFAQTADGALRVGFESVLADSRCPKGAQCVWAGDAKARVWVQQGNGPRQERDLHTAMSAAQSAIALDHEVRLVRLDPYPVVGKSAGTPAYVLTLVLTRRATFESTQ